MVSVCMASFNGEKYISEQIKSILMQLGDNDELIISDDGSTDNTLELIKSFNDSRIMIIQNDAVVKFCDGFLYYKISSNFCNALKHAKGDYIFLADQDDIWRADKIMVCLSKLQKFDLLLTNYSYIDSNGNDLNSTRFLQSPYKNRIYDFFRMAFHGSAMAFNRKILDICLPFPNHLIMHDAYIGLIAVLRGKYTFVNLPLTQYRIHASNASNHGRKSQNSIVFKVLYRLHLICSTIKHAYL